MGGGAPSNRLVEMVGLGDLATLVTLASDDVANFDDGEEDELGQEEHDRRIDYIEFPATDVAEIKRFYETVLGWKFTDYGPDYTSFSDGRLSGGFTTGGNVASNGPLVVLYAVDLEAVQKLVVSAGGDVTQDPYEFPGGRRFHFRDPSGNELAVWTDN